MGDFNAFKQDIIEKGSVGPWCMLGPQSAEGAPDWTALLGLIRKHCVYAFTYKGLSIENLKHVPAKELDESRIYLNKDARNGILLVDEGEVKASGPCKVFATKKAIVIARGKTLIRAYDEAHIEAYGSAVVQLHDKATCTLHDDARIVTLIEEQSVVNLF